MAAFRFKKSQKTYTVKAFSSLIQLAQRGMIHGDDPIFVPQIDRWVPAKAIKELRPHLSSEVASASTPQAPSSTPSPTPESSWLDNIPLPSARAASEAHSPQRYEDLQGDEDGSLEGDDALELPIAYVEAVSEEEVQARRDKYQAGMRELVENRKDRSKSRHRDPPSPKEPLSQAPPPGLVGLPMAEVGGVPFTPGSPSPRPMRSSSSLPEVDLSFAEPSSGRHTSSAGPRFDSGLSSGGGITVEEVPEGIRFGRIGAILALPVLALGLYYWQVNVVASQTFPDAPTPRILQRPNPAEIAAARATAPAPEVDDSREIALREKIPLKLRRPAVDIEEVQDDIFAELLNGGAYPKRVRVEPLAGEMPPHAALRKVEVVTSIAFGTTEGMDDDDQLALGALVIGKYIRAGELRVGEVVLVMEDEVGGAIGSYTLSAAQARDFYSRQVRLDELLGWLEAGSL